MQYLNFFFNCVISNKIKNNPNMIHMMKISIFGSGYAGLVTACGLSKFYEVICVDIDKNKVESINKGICPIYEQGIEQYIKNIKAVTSAEKAVKETEISFICIGTPSKEDGSFDYKFLESVSRSIGKVLKEKNSFHIVVVKSTVTPGTTEEIVLPIIEAESKKTAGKDFGISMNPEFLKEGTAIEDFLSPDRIVIGTIDNKTKTILNELYKPFNSVILNTDIKTAEMIKIASNSFLAAKISFINEISNICRKLKVNSYKTAEGMGLDKRIAPYFLQSGAGFGGSCFPKDIKALIAKSRELNYEPQLLNAVLKINENQPIEIIKMLENKLPSLENKKISILGLSFKPKTDDIRESPSIKVISELLSKNAEIHVFDPIAMENTKKIFENKVNYSKNISESLKNASACIIMTDWEDFKKLNKDNFSIMKTKIVIDGRKTISNLEDIDYSSLGGQEC